MQIHCSTLEEIDALWRLLAHVPDDVFVPCDVYLAGAFRYRVIRLDGAQTTAPVAGPQGCSCPTP